jgi:hypothetical protein
MEINESGIIRFGLNPDIQEKIPVLVKQASAIINQWLANSSIELENLAQ